MYDMYPENWSEKKIAEPVLRIPRRRARKEHEVAPTVPVRVEAGTAERR